MCTEMPTAICACDAAGIASNAKATSSSRNVLNARIKFTFPLLGLPCSMARLGALHISQALSFPLNPFSPKKSRVHIVHPHASSISTAPFR
jgi:hypothetical protein